MKMPITRIPTLDFSYKDNRKVNLPATLAGIVRKIPTYWRVVQTLKAVVRENRPDVIVNFFEPITGVYALTCRSRPPVVGVAHQFMYAHPGYLPATAIRLQQIGMKCSHRLPGTASTGVP